ncbi:MAG: hypothetical protein RIQ60_2017 [Pseudomonadota bacterium]|jgi:Mrp family chromosome partitioning ATPase
MAQQPGAGRSAIGGESTVDVDSLPGLGIKPMRSLGRHLRAGLTAAALVLLLGIPFAWIKGKSTYNAEGVFQVAPQFMKNLEGDKELELQSNSQYREFVNQLSNTVLRQDVVEKALADLKARGIDTRPPALTQRKYIDQLRRLVYVRAVPDTYMVKVGIDGTEREHLHDIINAVLQRFLETTRTEQIFGSSERLEALKKSEAKLRGEVADLESRRLTLAVRLNLTGMRENAENPYDQVLRQALERVSQAVADRVQAESAYAAFKAEREVPANLGRSLLEMKLQDNGLQSLRNEVVKRSEELQRARAGLEPRHPARQAADGELQDMAARLNVTEKAFERAVMANFESRVQGWVAQRRDIETAARDNLAELERKASDYARDYQEAMRLTAEIKLRDTDLGQLRERLNFLNRETNAIGFVRLVTPALPPDTPMGVGRVKMMLGVLVASLAMIVIFPIVLDMVDPHIHSVNDAEKLLGMPAAGWQVNVHDEATRRFAAEQTRRFVATLLRNRRAGGRNVFSFTAVKSGAGVTRLIDETAAALAQIGQRVLVVSLQQSNLAVDPAQRHEPGAAPGVQRVAWRQAPGGGLRRLDLLEAAIERWSARYDFVFFDLAPLLLSADAEMLVQATGQVLLVIDAEGVMRGEILRARRMLQKINPEAVGLVVTRIRVFRGSGYMENLIDETLKVQRPPPPTLRQRLRAWAKARAHQLGQRLRRRGKAAPGAEAEALPPKPTVVAPLALVQGPGPGKKAPPPAT